MSSIKAWLRKQYDKQNLIPHDFYHLQRDVKPKAALPLLYGSTFAVYGIALIAFVFVFIVQKRTYVTETTIETSDISDSKYTCSMASVVTSSKPTLLQEESGTYVTYKLTKYENLMSVSELYDQCVSDISTANPCESSLVYQAGISSFGYNLPVLTSTTYDPTSGQTPIALLSESTCGCDYQLFYYNPGSGKMVPSITFAPSYSYKNLVSVLGYHYVSGSQQYYVSGFQEPYQFTDGSTSMYYGTLFTNDNKGTLYVAFNQLGKVPEGAATYYFATQSYNSLALKSIESGGVPVTFDFNVTESGHGISLAAYNYSTSSFLYATNNGKVYAVIGGAAVSQILCTAYFIQFSVTGDVLYVGCTDGSIGRYDLSSTSFALLQLPSSCGVVSPAALSTNMGFSVLPDSMLLLSSPLTTQSTQFNLLFFNASSQQCAQVLKGFDGSVIGWSACGSQLQSSLPSNIYASNCSLNGLSWQLEFSYESSDGQSGIYATAEQMQAILTNRSALYCESTSICAQVRALPPYICTSRQHNSIFAVLSTALANSNALLGALIFLLGYLLPYAAGRGVTHSKSVDGRVEMGAEVRNPTTATA